MTDKQKRGQRPEGGHEQGKPHQPVSTNEISSSLGGMHFPAKRNDLERWAKDHNARSEVVENIHSMPDREYESMSDVQHGLSEKKRK